MNFDQKRREGDVERPTRDTTGSVGKRTGTMDLPESSRHGTAIQRVAGGAAPGSDIVHAAAREGISGPGEPLPYRDRIQQLFGRHDVSDVKAHIGGPAAEASRQMGAQAYATGDHVAFGSSPDLHTAAHEAAHTVQQRAGVHLQEGVGVAGDSYEQHADAVADKVVRNQSAEGLLDQIGRAEGSGSALVQRQQPTPNPEGEGAEPIPAAPLNAAQVADALRYYKFQPAKYPPDIIKQIQGEVGSTVSGTADEDMAQAVARRQIQINRTRAPTPLLAVDGKAGPRTLPVVFPVGLADKQATDAFTADVKKDKEKIDAAKTDQEKADLILGLVNARLSSATVGVPPLKQITASDQEANRFFPGGWRMNLMPKTLANSDQAAMTAYHEARHAEQFYRIARMLAGKGKSVAQIRAETGIDDDIAEQASRSPLKRGTMEALEAEGWHEVEVGKSPPPRPLENVRSDAALALAQAIKAWRADKTPQNRAKLEAAFNRFKKADEDVRNKPDEFDAYFLEDIVADNLGLPREPLTLELILKNN